MYRSLFLLVLSFILYFLPFFFPLTLTLPSHDDDFITSHIHLVAICSPFLLACLLDLAFVHYSKSIHLFIHFVLHALKTPNPEHTRSL
jgi:hypothetical protein